MPSPDLRENPDSAQYDNLLKFIGEYYALLGVDLEATKEDVTRAYKNNLKAWNLDKFKEDPELLKKAHIKIK